MDKKYYVYILANKKNGTLYLGFTSNLIKRVWEHKNKVIKGFTARYGVDKLVYFEQLDDPYNAITREKRLKKYKRKWKLALIEKDNPHWNDIFQKLISGVADAGLPGQAGQ
jgi:putative endonuclease